MEAGKWTRTSLAAAAVILLCAGYLLPGCAPHRRGQLPARDGVSSPPQKSVSERLAPTQIDSLPRWQKIDQAHAAADRVCDLALSFLGIPYRYGGATPAGFDCSGLVQYVYHEEGIDLPRTARNQSRAGSATTLKRMLRGDLIFFHIDRDVISHVGIYVGRGRFVHAPGSGKYVRTDSLDNSWWRKRVKAVRRILDTPPLAG